MTRMQTKSAERDGLKEKMRVNPEYILEKGFAFILFKSPAIFNPQNR